MSLAPAPQEPSDASHRALRDQVGALEAALLTEQQRSAALLQERDRLRSAYEQLKQELELLKRRLFIAKSERVCTAQLELQFAATQAALSALESSLSPPGKDAAPTPPAPVPPPPRPKPNKPSPTGRRNLQNLDHLPQERIELRDPALDELVAQGRAQFLGFEESYKLAYQRGGHKRLVLARAKYLLPAAEPVPRVAAPTPPLVDAGLADPAPRPAAAPSLPAVAVAPAPPQLHTVPVPKEVVSRCLAAPSLLAHILVDKFCDGLPLHRIEDRLAREGVCVDRGTMSRWVEHLGATLGATVVHAARTQALATAFCLATDATSIPIQPNSPTGPTPCNKGHFFVVIADKDHVFFDYVPKETSRAVQDLFPGFSGYIQADAKSVYDLLFHPQQVLSPVLPEAPGPCIEVGCWSHARRKFWEAAITTKCPVAQEGLLRIGRFFFLEQSWRHLAPLERHQQRLVHLRPLMDDFFAWVHQHWPTFEPLRGLLRGALGYVRRQEAALRRPLEDGRLVLENNRSERALRSIAVGRKAWLFCGSDAHATAAGHIFSLIASARLHQLDPECYLREVLRVLPLWPKDRYLELAPLFWAHTRALLDPAQLAAEFGPLDIPPPRATPPPQQPSPG